MYSPDQLEPNDRFIVAEYQAMKGSVKISDVLLKTFADEEAAEAALLAIDTFKGEELDVIRVQEDGDEMVMSCFEWDAEQNKYVVA